MGPKHGLGLRCQRGILDPGLGEGLDHAPIEHRVGGLVDDRAPVVGLEVDRVDRPRIHELGDQPSSQEVVGSSLKRSRGYSSRRRRSGSSVGGSPRRRETTKRTGSRLAPELVQGMPA